MSELSVSSPGSASSDQWLVRLPTAADPTPPHPSINNLATEQYSLQNTPKSRTSLNREECLF